MDEHYTNTSSDNKKKKQEEKSEKDEELISFSPFSRDTLVNQSPVFSNFPITHPKPVHAKITIHVNYDSCEIFQDTFRSSHERCYVKKMFLKIWQYSQENTCVGVFFIRVAGC